MADPVENIFAHTIGRADLIGGVVRCELTTLIPGDSGSDRPQSVATHALIMPVEGFLRAFATLDDLVHKLAEAGVIRSQERKSEASPAVEKTGGAALPKSPNFK